jgi:hypothetical protein
MKGEALQEWHRFCSASERRAASDMSPSLTDTSPSLGGNCGCLTTRECLRVLSDKAPAA